MLSKKMISLMLAGNVMLGISSVTLANVEKNIGSLDVRSKILIDCDDTNLSRSLNKSIADSEVPSQNDKQKRFGVASDAKGTKYEAAAEVLGALNIMAGDSDTGLLRPNEFIKRSEIAKLGICVSGLTDMFCNTNDVSKFKFSDVNSDHWASKFIHTAQAQGLMIGYENREFKPDNNIKLAEAVAIIVRILGYTPAAEAKGGYPAGYMAIASQNGILEGVDTKIHQYATRGDVAQMLFNALSVNLMEPIEYSSDIPYRVVEKTLLEDVLKVHKGCGQIKANSNTAISHASSELQRGQVMIDDSVYLCGDSRAEQLLGQQVVYYYKNIENTGENVLLLATVQQNKNQTKIINAVDIDEVVKDGETGKIKLVCWENSSNDKELKTMVISRDAKLIYNGQYEELNLADLKPTSGSVMLLDTQGIGEYDIVFADWFETIVVDEYSEKAKNISDKAGGSLSLNDEININYSILRNGSIIKPSELKPWSVLSVVRNNYRKDNRELKAVKAYVSDKSVTGRVTEKYDNKYIINGREYSTVCDCVKTLRLGQMGTFYLDIEGRIAAVDEAAELTNNYAYLIDIAEDGEFESPLHFKLFDTHGNVIIAKGVSKVRLNDEYNLGHESFLAQPAITSNGKVIPQLITYETNSNGKITAIYTASTELKPNIDKFSKNVEERLEYNSLTHKLGNISLDSNTVVLDIPLGANNDAEKFAVRDISMFVDGGKYDVSLYDLSEDYIAKVVVVANYDVDVAWNYPMAVVDKVTEAHKANDNTSVNKLYALKNGVPIELFAAGKNVLVKSDSGNTTSLTRGDVIQYKTNAEGEIESVEVIFDANSSKLDKEFENTNFADLKLVYGKVVQKFPDSINVAVNDGQIINYSIANAQIYEYDSASPSGSVKSACKSVIQQCESTDSQRVFLKIYKDVVQEIVVVN